MNQFDFSETFITCFRKNAEHMQHEQHSTRKPTTKQREAAVDLRLSTRPSKSYCVECNAFAQWLQFS